MLGLRYDMIAGYTGQDKISLRDLAANPEAATAQVISNVRNNAFEGALFFTTFEFGQRFTRKMLKTPINRVNRMIFTGKDAPLRGMGLRI